MFTIETAIELAAQKHAGQKRLNGEPYIYHLLRVMSKMKTEEERIIAVLHDIIEDTDVTVDDLLKMGCPKLVVNSISILTNDKHISYAEYIEFIAGLHVEGGCLLSAASFRSAIRVKIEDLSDNLNIADLGHALTDKDSKRITKYIEAINFLRSRSI